MNKKIVFDNRKSVRIIVVLYVLIHIGFVATGFLPDRSRYTFSPFREAVYLTGSRSVSLIRWDYAPDEHTMELVFDFTDSAYSKGGIAFDAVYDGKKNLESNIVYQKEDMLIIQLYHIPEQQGKKITVSFEMNEDGNSRKASFYSYTGIINEVMSLPVRTEREYYVSRQEYDIAYYNSLIDAAEKSIADKRNSVTEIENDNQRLSSNDTKLTMNETLNLSETIQNNNSMIEELNTEIDELNGEIKEYKDIIQVLKDRIN